MANALADNLPAPKLPSGKSRRRRKTRRRDAQAQQAGVIMVAAFMGFVVGSFVEPQQFGFGLAAAVFIDVRIVRALLLPSAMKLFGRWNWWLPARIARIFRVEPSRFSRRRGRSSGPPADDPRPGVTWAGVSASSCLSWGRLARSSPSSCSPREECWSGRP